MKRINVGITALVGALILGLLAPTAATATTNRVSGEVNCTGSIVNYKTVRTMSGSSIRLDLTKAAGSARGGWYTAVGAYVTKTGKTHWASFYGAPDGRSLIPGGYLAGTSFKLRAHMSKSVGTCYPNWAGNLKF